MGLDASASGARTRSIYERMTNPTPQDLNGVAEMANWRRDQVKMMIEKVLLESLRHIEAQREDFKVAITTDDGGWSVRIDMKQPHDLNFGKS